MSLVPFHQAAEIFEGCTPMPGRPRRVKLPDGSIVGRAQFNTIYGGHTWISGEDGVEVTYSAWCRFVTLHKWRP